LKEFSREKRDIREWQAALLAWTLQEDARMVVSAAA